MTWNDTHPQLSKKVRPAGDFPKEWLVVPMLDAVELTIEEKQEEPIITVKECHVIDCPICRSLRKTE